MSENEFFKEAVNSMKASNTTLLLARIFGKKIVGKDRELNCTVTMYRWRGITYMHSVKYSKEGK